MFGCGLCKSSLRVKLERMPTALRGALEKVRDLSSVVVGVEAESGVWLEAVEEVADAAVSERLRQGVVEGPHPMLTHY